jgi:hypothetical protein
VDDERRPLWENWDKPGSGSWPWPERIAIAVFVVFVGLIALTVLVLAVVHASGCDCGGASSARLRDPTKRRGPRPSINPHSAREKVAPVDPLAGTL